MLDTYSNDISTYIVTYSTYYLFGLIVSNQVGFSGGTITNNSYFSEKFYTPLTTSIPIIFPLALNVLNLPLDSTNSHTSTSSTRILNIKLHFNWIAGRQTRLQILNLKLF